MAEHPASLPVPPDVAPQAAPARAAPARHAAALVGLTLGVLVLFAPALLGLGTFAYRDSGRMHGPHKRFIAERLARGELPEWNPYGGLGFPLVGGAVDAVQHPFNAFLVALPFHAAYTAWVVLSVLLAALGTFAWLRSFGLGTAAATASGFAVGFSGFIVSSSDNVQYLTALASVPLLLASAHRFGQRPGPARGAAVALASGFAAAAGDPQSWGIALGLLVLQTLVCMPEVSRRSRAGRAAVLVVLAIGGAAPFFAPVLAWMPHSSRGEPLVWVEYERFNLLPARLLELAVPGMFGLEPLRPPHRLYQALAGDIHTPVPWVLSEYAGIGVLAAAAYGAVRRRAGALLLLAAGLFLWASMGKNAGFGQLAEHVPVLAGFRYWEKVAFFAVLLAAAAAALGVEAWLSAPRRARPLLWIAGIVTVAAAALHVLFRAAPAVAGAWLGRPESDPLVAQLAGNVARGALHTALAGLALTALVLVALRGLLAGRRLALAGVAFLALDLAAVNVRAYVLVPTPSVDVRSRFGERLASEPGQHRVTTPIDIPSSGPDAMPDYEREMLHGAALLYSAWNVDHRVGSFTPFTGMIPARAMRFQHRTGYLHQIPQIGMWGIDHLVLPVGDRKERELGLSYPLRVVDEDPAHGALLVELPHRPRAYLADVVAPVDRRGAMHFVLSPASVTSDRTVVEGDVPAGLSPPRGAVRLVRDEPEHVVLDVETDRAALVVLNDTFAPGWSATANGAQVRILAANYLARGVFVGSGRHEVVFRYRTPWLAGGWLVACAFGVALGGWGLIRRCRTSRGDSGTSGT